MTRLRRLFGEIPMPWWKVLVLAVAAGAYTALTCLVPGVAQTSLHDIAVMPDAWVLLAVFIIVNCRRWWEAALKCFVFFLISQPLVYLIQVPFATLGWGIFMYYPRWGIITLLTLPGAAVAFLVKRRDWISVAVLSVADALLAALAVTYCGMMVRGFPFHLLSMLFCVAVIALFIAVLLDKPAHRLTAAGLAVAATAVTVALTGLRGLNY